MSSARITAEVLGNSLPSDEADTGGEKVEGTDAEEAQFLVEKPPDPAWQRQATQVSANSTSADGLGACAKLSARVMLIAGLLVGCFALGALSTSGRVRTSPTRPSTSSPSPGASAAVRATTAGPTSPATTAVRATTAGLAIPTTTAVSATTALPTSRATTAVRTTTARPTSPATTVAPAVTAAAPVAPTAAATTAGTTQALMTAASTTKAAVRTCLIQPSLLAKGEKTRQIRIVPSVDICGALCFTSKACKSYGYIEDAGSCFLNLENMHIADGFCPRPKAPGRDFSAPVKGCAIDGSSEVVGRVAREVEEVPTTNVCAILCQADPLCTSFVYGKKRGPSSFRKCFLKAVKDPHVVSALNFNAGRCPKPEQDCKQVPMQKLVVNSHVKYSKPLEVLLKSLLNVQFQAGCPRMSNVVTVLGGAAANTNPQLASGRWGELGVTVINMTVNAMDFNGLSAIYHHIDHPLVRANSYFYVLDTVVFGERFPQNFDRFAATVQKNDIHLPEKPNSDIFVFGHGVARRYKTNYDHDISKAQGLEMEWNWNWKNPPHITKFAKKVVVLNLRQQVGNEDPYNTTFRRAKFWYPDFDLYKYIMMWYHGDITDGQLFRNR